MDFIACELYLNKPPQKVTFHLDNALQLTTPFSSITLLIFTTW